MRFLRICQIGVSELLIFAIVGLQLSAVLFTAGCSKKEEDEKEVTEQAGGIPRQYFADWLKSSSRAFELRYPRNEEIASRIESIGAKCDTIARFVAMYMNVQPTQKIYLMIFQNKFKAEELLGHELPYVSGDTIFYEILAPLGTGITKYMMTLAAPQGSQFEFVNEGLPTLLDFSGEDYHERALDYFENDEMFPLTQLVDNEVYAKLPQLARREQAASFLGFLSYDYGPRPIVGLLREGLSANGILMIATKKSLEVLEQEWKSELPRLSRLDSLDTQP